MTKDCLRAASEAYKSFAAVSIERWERILKSHHKPDSRTSDAVTVRREFLNYVLDLSIKIASGVMSVAPSRDRPARFTFHPLEAYRRKPSQYTLLPFRFMRFDATKYVLVNEVGEFIFLGNNTFRSFATH
jgi:hypothetical protein